MRMEYANIALDIAEQFSNVVIHIGDFQHLKENFQVILLLNDDLLSSAE